MAKKLHCGHIFHLHCLRSWIEQDTVCPACRTQIVLDKPEDPIPREQNPRDQNRNAPENRQARRDNIIARNRNLQLARRRREQQRPPVEEEIKDDKEFQAI